MPGSNTSLSACQTVPFIVRCMMADPADLRTRLARSITAGTGALVGGMGVATPIVAAALAEVRWGRPAQRLVWRSSWQ